MEGEFILVEAAEYNQLPEESLADWKYRIILGKARKQVKMSWQEISDMLCLGCSNEYLRKLAYGVLEYDNYLKARREEAIANGREENAFTELENKEFELRREKMRMQDQKRELNKKLREWARAEHLQEEILKAIRETVPVERAHKQPVLNSISEKEAALLLSDWHVGMRTANMVNTFNDSVLEQRIQELLSRAIQHGHEQDIRCVHVFALGDLVNGLIHVTTRINNEENVIKQSMKAAEILAHIINELSEEFPEVKVYFSRGNHDRVTANKKESICGESFSDIIWWYLKARAEGIDNIVFVDNEIDDEIVMADICGNKIFAVHGHKDKINHVVPNLSLLLKTFPDYIFMGHYHSNAESEIHGAEVIVNSALCGTDDYAVSLRRSSHPAQKFIVFDKKGRVCTYDIRLD